MNLNHILVPIRVRDFAAICDLSLRLLRHHSVPLVAGLLVVAVPLAVFNWWVCQLPVWGHSVGMENPAAGILQVGLVYLESQLASAPMTVWLGRAMFRQKPTVRNALGDLWNRLGHVLYVQLVCRPTLLVVACVWMMTASGFKGEFWGTAAFFGSLALLCTVLIRMARPYSVEIMLLERTPVRVPADVAVRSARHAAAVDPGSRVSYSRRSKNLHTFASNMILGRSMAGAVILGALTLSVYAMLMFLDQTLGLGLGGNTWARQLFWVVALWTTVGVSGVIRFLSYIDLRVRQEGWDAELKLRAEAAKLAVT